MAFITDYAFQTVPAVSYQIDIPFNISNLGRVAVVQSSDVKAYRNQVISVISTGTQERVWYDQYGAGFTAALFENSTQAAGMVRQAVSEAFVRWLPKLKFNEISVDFDSTTGILSFTVVYQTPSGQQDSVKIVTSSLSASGGIIYG